MTQIPEPDPQEKAETSSIGDLIGEVSKDFSTLLRQEMELAKAELRQSATRAGKGAGLYGGAGVAGYMTVLFLSIALWWGLGYLVGNAWSAVIVAAVWGVIALVMFLVGKRQMDAVKGMPQTVETVKEIPDALK
jgi:Protein of unknown function (DUF1469).